jgi:CheY-like chemotaxis protein
MHISKLDQSSFNSLSQRNNDPIIIVDDDRDDLDIMREAFKQLEVPNELITFNDAFKFIEYMTATKERCIFILCDINMHKMGGLDLMKRVFSDPVLRLKCIPFLFFSTSGATVAIMEAYSFGVQGYFVKPSSMLDYKKMFYSMISYWSYSQNPNN